MGIFSSIKNAIFGGEAKAQTGEDNAAIAVENPPHGNAATVQRAAISTIDVAERLDNIPGADALNWRTSIVDLMKLVKIDASYANRKELAQEMGQTNYNGTADDNIWLHKRVMEEIAANGGIVPDDLKS